MITTVVVQAPRLLSSLAPVPVPVADGLGLGLELSLQELRIA